jgi:hypothetical protein
VESLRALAVACSKKRRLSLTVGLCRTLLDILLEQLRGGLVRLGRSASAFPRRERRSPVGHPRVALEVGEAYTEKASCSGLGDPFFLDGSDDPDSQIFRIGLHESHDLPGRLSGLMIMLPAAGLMIMLPAVEEYH